MDECHATLAADETAEVQSLQTNKKYWISDLRLEVLFSTRKLKISSPKENNYSFRQFLVVHLNACLCVVGADRYSLLLIY